MQNILLEKITLGLMPLLRHKTIREKFLLDFAKNTKFGKEHGFSKILSYEDWKKSVPIRDYEALKPYIDLVVKGENNILWPGKPIYFFAKPLAQLLEASIFLLVSNL